MSRRHDAPVVGEGKVCLICDNCQKEEWHRVVLEHDDTCMEFAAVEQNDEWQFADDALVCSDKCATEFWEW